MDEDELVQLRLEQTETVSDLAHAYPSIAELVDGAVDVAPMADGDEHEIACRLIADEIFERHRDHLEALAATHVLDMVAKVASKLGGSTAASSAAASLQERTVPALRAEIGEDPPAETGEAEREQQLRDAVALVLAASSLRKTSLER